MMTEQKRMRTKYLVEPMDFRVLLGLAILLHLGLSRYNSVVGQAPELLVIDFPSGVLDTIDAFDYDTVPTFYSMVWSQGEMGQVHELPLTPPMENLWQDAQFSERAPAAEFMAVTSYPARTAATMFIYRNGERIRGCSANLVGRRHALTSAQCVFYTPEDAWSCDSVSIAPAYDNGFETLGDHIATKAYIPIGLPGPGSGYGGSVLIELREPIGDEIGWVGLASTKLDAYFEGKVFHKFVYPAYPNPWDPSQVYNGDTLYYHNGFVQPLEAGSPYLVVPGPDAHGLPNNEEGSSLIHTDNAAYYTLGVQTYSSGYRHVRVGPSVFAAFSSVIENNSDVGISRPNYAAHGSYFYPNPAYDQGTLVLTAQPATRTTLEIVDTQGRTALTTTLAQKETSLDISKLSRGLYLYRVRQDDRPLSTGRIVLE